MPTQDDILRGLERICDAVADLAIVKEAIEEMRTLVEGGYAFEITDEEQTALLKAYTGEVVRLGVVLNCYPLGSETQVIFDVDGNLIG